MEKCRIHNDPEKGMQEFERRWRKPKLQNHLDIFKEKFNIQLQFRSEKHQQSLSAHTLFSTIDWFTKPPTSFACELFSTEKCSEFNDNSGIKFEVLDQPLKVQCQAKKKLPSTITWMEYLAEIPIFHAINDRTLEEKSAAS